jgi:hypothetical protein
VFGRSVVPAAALAVLAVACSRVPAGPYTRVQLFNVSNTVIEVDGRALEHWTSHRHYTVHGETDSVALKSGGMKLATLVIKSLVPTGDPSNYDAAVNIHRDSLSHFYPVELSPYIDAEIVE